MERDEFFEKLCKAMDEGVPLIMNDIEVHYNKHSEEVSIKQIDGEYLIERVIRYTTRLEKHIEQSPREGAKGEIK